MNARSEHEATAEFAERVRLNQRELAANLKPQSLEAVFESSDVERFGWILMEV